MLMSTGYRIDKILGLFKDGVIFEPESEHAIFLCGVILNMFKKDEDTAFSNYYQARIW